MASKSVVTTEGLCKLRRLPATVECCFATGNRRASSTCGHSSSASIIILRQLAYLTVLLYFTGGRGTFVIEDVEIFASRKNLQRFLVWQNLKIGSSIIFRTGKSLNFWSKCLSIILPFWCWCCDTKCQRGSSWWRKSLGTVAELTTAS